MLNNPLHNYKTLKILFYLCIMYNSPMALRAGDEIPATAARLVGHIENRLIEECSGLEASPTQPDLLWAINDSGLGPYLYALGSNGRHRGRYHVKGAANRDWEGLDAFRWKNSSHLLIADFGDNRQERSIHRLYFIAEPQLSPENAPFKGMVSVTRRIEFRYPDGNHDAEGVAVDVLQEKILLVTKRDTPPLMFEIPLFAPSTNQTVTAKLVGPVSHLPPPTPQDLSYPYGEFRSQPTAMDISADTLKIVLLTYKHAYIYSRSLSETWARSLSHPPRLIPLPLPEKTPELRQREAICFKNSNAPATIIVTSEGINAGLYQIAIRNN